MSNWSQALLALAYGLYARGAGQLGPPLQRARQARANANFGAEATLAWEGVIENNQGSRDRISVGSHSHVRGRLLTYGHGGQITMGSWCYVGVHTEIWSMESITIGDRVLISHDVNIHDGTAHSSDARERHDHFRAIVSTGHPRQGADLPGVRSAPVVIEDDVWISFGVTILRGVRIGAGSIIAAGALVTSDVPAGVLYRCEVRQKLSPLPATQQG